MNFNMNINIPFLFDSQFNNVTNTDFTNLSKNKLFTNHLDTMNTYEKFLKGDINNEVLFRDYKKVL